MKIENNGPLPISPGSTEGPRRIIKKDSTTELERVRSGKDKAEMSEHARMLAKARAALGNVEETDMERLLALRKQIESGDYTVQASELARKLMTKVYSK